MKKAIVLIVLICGEVYAAEKPLPLPMPPVTVRHRDGEFGSMHRLRTMPSTPSSSCTGK